MGESLPEENTSGQGGDPPLEAGTGRFHRGAWFFGWIWALAHGLDRVALADLLITGPGGYCGVLLIVALEQPMGDAMKVVVSCLWGLCFVGAVAWRVYLGRVGRRWAWEHARNRDAEGFKEIEGYWELAAAYVFGLGMIASLLLDVAGFAWAMRKG